MVMSLINDNVHFNANGHVKTKNKTKNIKQNENERLGHCYSLFGALDSYLYRSIVIILWLLLPEACVLFIEVRWLERRFTSRNEKWLQFYGTPRIFCHCSHLFASYKTPPLPLTLWVESTTGLTELDLFSPYSLLVNVNVRICFSKAIMCCWEATWLSICFFSFCMWIDRRIVGRTQNNVGSTDFAFVRVCLSSASTPAAWTWCSFLCLTETSLGDMNMYICM